MFNRSAYHNSRPGGVSSLEVVDGIDDTDQPHFVPLRRTDLHGEIVGPLASLKLVHTYGYSREECDHVLEALYRFPLPGDAAVTGVCVRFGDVEITTQLKPREEAESDYQQAVNQGKQAALLTREAPDVFTLRIAGIRPDEDIIVETDYVQMARPQADQAGWLLRVPLTTAPRYVREDELVSRHAHGQPLALLRDPGHRFALDLRLRDARDVRSVTHQLDVTSDGPDGPDGDERCVRLREGDVLPDRDFVLTWRPEQAEDHPALHVYTHEDAEYCYYLALVAPPATHQPGTGAAREIILLVDHSGSMSGAKWEASDWTVNSFLSTLTERDCFDLGLFHTTTKWFRKRPVPATATNLRAASKYLDENRDSGGTNLGVALEQALNLARTDDENLARHILIVTDAQVSDDARLFRLADTEAAREHRRRISMICIDAAPNSFLANELAERGGGVAYFLTSDPDEEDITTALEGVLADWAEPVLVDLRLKIDGESNDLGDLPRGRARWVAGRVPVGKINGETGDVLDVCLVVGDQVITTRKITPDSTLPAIKALFGARRLLALDYLIRAQYPPQQLRAQLTRLGYDLDVILAEEESVYAENTRQATQEALTPLLIEESLRYGIVCTETGFIAVREEAGERIEATAVVANALPQGWSGSFLGFRSAPMMVSAGAPPTDSEKALRTSSFVSAVVRAPSVQAPQKKGAGETTGPITVFSGVPVLSQGEAVLFDSTQRDDLPSGVTLTHIALQFDGPVPHPIDRGIKLLIYVGDLAMPRATVRIADLVRVGNERPLNLRRRKDDVVRLVLRDPNGAWASGAPKFNLSLGI